MEPGKYKKPLGLLVLFSFIFLLSFSLSSPTLETEVPTRVIQEFDGSIYTFYFGYSEESIVWEVPNTILPDSLTDIEAAGYDVPLPSWVSFDPDTRELFIDRREYNNDDLDIIFTGWDGAADYTEQITIRTRIGAKVLPLIEDEYDLAENSPKDYQALKLLNENIFVVWLESDDYETWIAGKIIDSQGETITELDFADNGFGALDFHSNPQLQIFDDGNVLLTWLNIDDDLCGTILDEDGYVEVGVFNMFTQINTDFGWKLESLIAGIRIIWSDWNGDLYERILGSNGYQIKSNTVVGDVYYAITQPKVVTRSDVSVLIWLQETGSRSLVLLILESDGDIREAQNVILTEAIQEFDAVIISSGDVVIIWATTDELHASYYLIDFVYLFDSYTLNSNIEATSLSAYAFPADDKIFLSYAISDSYYETTGNYALLVQLDSDQSLYDDMTVLTEIKFDIQYMENFDGVYDAPKFTKYSDTQFMITLQTQSDDEDSETPITTFWGIFDDEGDIVVQMQYLNNYMIGQANDCYPAVLTDTVIFLWEGGSSSDPTVRGIVYENNMVYNSMPELREIIPDESAELDDEIVLDLGGYVIDYDYDELTYYLSTDRDIEDATFDTTTGTLRATFKEEGTYNFKFYFMDHYFLNEHEFQITAEQSGSSGSKARLWIIIGASVGAALIVLATCLIFRHRMKLKRLKIHSTPVSLRDSYPALNMGATTSGLELSSNLNGISSPHLQLSPTGGVPEKFICAHSMEIMTDPVDIVTQNGHHTYERGLIESWLANNNLDPISGEEVSMVVPNTETKQMIEDHLATLTWQQIGGNYVLREQLKRWVMKKGKYNLLRDNKLYVIVNMLDQFEKY